MPGVLRGAFRGRDMENTRSEGEETLWGCPRISEEKQLIMADSDGTNRTLAQETCHGICPMSKAGLGACHRVEVHCTFPTKIFAKSNPPL